MLVMGLMLGESGRELVKKFAGQASGTGPAVTANWGQMVTKQLPASMMNSLTRRMRKMLLKKYAAKASGSFVGRIDLHIEQGRIIGHRHRLIPIDDTFAEDAAMAAMVEEARAEPERGGPRSGPARVEALAGAGVVEQVDATPSYSSMPGRADTGPSRVIVLRRR